MAFSRETAAGVSEDIVRPAVGVERVVVGLGQGLTAAEAASG